MVAYVELSSSVTVVEDIYDIATGNMNAPKEGMGFLNALGLAKPHPEIEWDIELFLGPSSNECCWEDICNGGSPLAAVIVPDNSNSAIDPPIFIYESHHSK